MDSLNKARDTQLHNIQNKTGKNLDELRKLILESDFQKHGEIRKMIIERFGLGFGDATMLVHYALQTDGQTAAESSQSSIEEILQEIYSGSKSTLRPLHEKVMHKVDELGEYTVAPKKGYLSLRRKRQFAMIGPGTKNRLEIGLNMKGIPPTNRLIEQPAGGMCQYKIYLVSEEDVDKDFLNYLQIAFNTSG
jgi:hypothetical protein